MENHNGAINDHSDKPPFEYNLITDQIYLDEGQIARLKKFEMWCREEHPKDAE